MTTYTTLLFNVKDGIAHVTLNRPDAANSIDATMAHELTHAAKTCANDDAIRCVLLTGAGKLFCAGGDLKAFAGFGDRVASEIRQLADALHHAVTLLCRMEKPLVIAVNGAAAGAGFSLALCGDIVLAGSSAKFSMAYTHAGLTPDGGATWLLPRITGVRRAQQLILTNRRLSADEALQWGLVTGVVADDALQHEAEAIAKQLAQGPTHVYGQVKRLLLDGGGNTLEQHLHLEAVSIAAMSARPDGQEGIHAFIEKRKAVFTGK